LKNSSFWAHIYKELRGAVFSSSFEEQLWGAFSEQLSGRSFGKSLWEAAFGSNFGKK
jgi:hypothetical protein